jgi:type I restriction-modification system DNA methylase subunit
MNIYDPTCGSGGMLLESVHYLERQGKNPKSLTLYGQEKHHRRKTFEQEFTAFLKRHGIQYDERYVIG